MARPAHHSVFVRLDQRLDRGTPEPGVVSPGLVSMTTFASLSRIADLSFPQAPGEAGTDGISPSPFRIIISLRTFRHLSGTFVDLQKWIGCSSN
jgi:hypothetical protein